MSVDYGSEPTWKEFDCNIISKTKRRIALAVDRHTTHNSRAFDEPQQTTTNRPSCINQQERTRQAHRRLTSTDPRNTSKNRRQDEERSIEIMAKKSRTNSADADETPVVTKDDEHLDDVKDDEPLDDVKDADEEKSKADDNDTTSALIAQAAFAAVNAALDVDVNAVAALAVEAVEAEETKVAAEDAAQLKKNEQRRKRYREKTVEEETQPDGPPKKKGSLSHEEQLAARRMKDRERYATMTAEQRRAYNSKRRDQYHRQTENSRQKRRERERNRYHSLTTDDAKDRNARRAKLERERYQKLSPTDLEVKNRKRRERAANARHKKDGDKVIPSRCIPVSPTLFRELTLSSL